MSTLDDIEIKLSAARTRLIIEKPFLGALVLRLPLVPAMDGWCPTTATDARKIYYNPEYIEVLDLDETQFMLAHEALHCALSHFARRGKRDKCRWDIACDLAINPLLVSEGFKLPRGALLLDGYEGMTAEEIYPAIEENLTEQTLDKHVYDEGETSQTNNSSADAGDLSKYQARKSDMKNQQESSDNAENNAQAKTMRDNGENTSALAEQPPPLSITEKSNLDTQWQQRLAGAAQLAIQAGK
ncbi:MAG TPA: hypothetical protein VK999_09080, partial [Methylotenera sp.]|nr:hypothetical protein [Methylotenera sp.]